MFLQSGVLAVPPEVGLGTKTGAIAVIDPTIRATVSEARQLLLDAYFVWRLIETCLLRMD
jgi:hypothetical protein